MNSRKHPLGCEVSKSKRCRCSCATAGHGTQLTLTSEELRGGKSISVKRFKQRVRDIVMGVFES